MKYKGEEMFDVLRQFNCWTILLRLMLAVIFGAFIGLNREHRKMPAGLRTYIIVCIGACLTSLLALYETEMINGPWAHLVTSTDVKTDVSRFSAQVINGIGFLAAGTIMSFEGSSVRGVTTAACLWASTCMGIAIGYGFYECAIIGWLLILLVIKVLPIWQGKLREIARKRG